MNMCVCILAYVGVYSCICICVYIYIHTCIYIYVYMYIYACACAFTSVNVNMYIHTILAHRLFEFGKPPSCMGLGFIRPDFRPLGSALRQNSNRPHYPKGPCSSIVYAWASKGFLYPYLWAYVGTVWILRPFGLYRSPSPEACPPCRTSAQKSGSQDFSWVLCKILKGLQKQ